MFPTSLLLQRIKKERIEEVRLALRRARISRSAREFLQEALNFSFAFSLAVFFLVLFLGLWYGIPYFPLLAVLSGVGAGYGLYRLFLLNLEHTGRARSKEIETRLPHAIAFMLAMSKGGVGIIQIFRELSKHREDYGEICKEASAVVRNVEAFGMSPVQALTDVAETTPSEKFKEFLKTLSTVVETGTNLSDFLASRCEKAYFEAKDAQLKSFETVSIMAEISTITIGLLPFLLLVTLLPMQMMSPIPPLVLYATVYLAIPLGSALFIFLLSQYSPWEAKHPPRLSQETKGLGRRGSLWMEFPHRLFPFLRTLPDDPVKVFYLSVPAAALFALLRFSTDLLNLETKLGLEPQAETTFVLSLVIALLPFIILHELRERRIEKIITITPDYLSSLSAAVSSGLPPGKAIKTLPPERFGALAPELAKVKKDIEWGSPASRALSEMERRIRSGLLMRVISVMNIASSATSNIGDVLNVLANDVSTEVHLKRERRAQTFTYVLIAYMIFGVFAITAVGMVVIFVPALPTQSVEMPGGMGIGINPINPGMVRSLFYHAVLMQAIALGILAGQFRTGRIRDGLKHSLLMCVMGWLIFTGVELLPLSSFLKLPTISPGG
ncbi:MAG: type II secretion system F family protein [Candidatus Hadarchaeales archaeon]